MKLNKYFVYLDDGSNVMKVAIPAKSEKEARNYVEGNGEVIAIKNVTDDFPISSDKIARALLNAGFGQIEVDLVVRTLQQTDITD